MNDYQYRCAVYFGGTLYKKPTRIPGPEYCQVLRLLRTTLGLHGHYYGRSPRHGKDSSAILGEYEQ